ncbi:hypothetical protein ABW21_db0209713 [Orbilia brochopaga]|nr:hypothetical protein ABW21_db0209713 [Drechslerella brochopaga]
MGRFHCPAILIIGHGELGLEIIKSLANHPSKPAFTTFTVLARPQTVASLPQSDPEKYSLLDKCNVRWLPLDISSASQDDLTAAFRSFTAVIHASGMFAQPGVPTKVARAVLAAGVRFFMPWQFGVDYDAIGPDAGNGLFAEQYGIRQLLRDEDSNTGGTAWNIVSNGLFASFVWYEPFGIVNKREHAVTALGGWENKVTLTAAEDIGRMTADVIFERFAGKRGDGVVYIAGETVTYAQIADDIEEKWGQPVQRKVLDLETVREKLEKDPEDQLARYQLVFGEGVGCSWDAASTYNEEKGVKLTNFREWMDTHEF